MTAIFAYVKGDQAMIAADTLRRDPAGWLPSQTVGKVFCWANCIPFAGAGNGPRLEKLAQEMLNNQSNFSPDEAGFMAAFKAFQPSHYQVATSGTSAMTRSPQLTQGTFLVAVPAMNGCPEKLFELDFATGAQNDLPLDLATQGANAGAFLQIAQQALASRTTQAGLPGDLWAADCVRGAINICPNDVGLPFDVVITRPNGAVGWSALSNRFTALPSVGSQAFLIS